MRSGRSIPLVIILVGLAVAVFAGLRQRAGNEETKQLRLRTVAERVLIQLKLRMRIFEYEVRAARGVIIGAGGAAISRKRFHAYTRSRDLAREFPGSLDQGFVRRVAAADEAAFLRAARRDDAPDFVIRPREPHDGERFVVQYLEPAELDSPALGLDIASEPIRRAAAMQAMRTGEPTLTPPLKLVRTDLADRIGVALLLPVYRGMKPPAPGERERSTIGWVFTRLALEKVFADFDDYGGEFTMRIADVTKPDQPIPAFSSFVPGDAAEGLLVGSPVRMFGREWMVEIIGTHKLVTDLRLTRPLFVSGRIVILSSLLAGLLFVYLHSRERRLRVSIERERLASIVEFSEDAIIAEDMDGIVTDWNAGATRIFGYEAAEMVGQRLDLIDSEDARSPGGEVRQQSDALRLAKDGRTVIVSLTESPLRDRRGAVVGMSIIARDTSRQERAESALRDSLEETAQLNHELEAHVLNRTEQLRTANTKLKTAAKQLQTAQRIAQVGSWELDIASGDGTWSEEMYRIMGMDPRTPAPRYHDQEKLFAPESWSKMAAGVDLAIGTGEGYALTLAVVRPDGTQRAIVTRAEVLRDESGRVERLVGTFQDVTERERASTQLQQLTERLQLATSAAKMGVWDWNIVDNELLWDDAMHRLYDTPRGKFGGAYEAWRAGVHPDDRAESDAAIAAAVIGPRDFETKFRVVHSNGEIRHVAAIAAVHRDPVTGRALRMVGVNWDITDQRVAELALRSSEALQRGILAHAGSAIIATDQHGLVTLFNHAAEALLGYDASEIVGVARPSPIYDPIDVAMRRAALEAEGVAAGSTFDVVVAKSRSGVADASEWTLMRKDGSRVSVLLTVSSLRGETGEIFGYLGVAVDLTRRKLQESELLKLNALLAERSTQAESASHAKGMFLANMSHEIRTPMGAITGVTYLLGKTALSSVQKDLVRTIERSTKTLLSMINDVLDLSKIEAQQLTLDVAPFRLSQLLAELEGLMTGYATGKNLELIVDAEADLPDELVGDRVRLMQILTNLAGNAIKFSDRGTVRVDVRRAAGEAGVGEACLRFEVHDSGPGMDDALLAKLFTPFTQAEGPGARRVGGTGLGLAIVKQLVTLMAGEVGVDSTPGLGSRFWFTITFALGHVDTSSLKVLIVDDDDDARRSLIASAERLGWKVEATQSGEHAVSMLIGKARPSHAFDAVIFDSVTAGNDELNVLASLRESTGTEVKQPSVLIASANDITLRARPEARFADGILAKPITASTLFDAMTKAVVARTGSSARVGFAMPSSEVGQRLPGARLLVVDDSEVNRDIACRILELEGAELETATNGVEAVERVLSSQRAFDAVLMDIQMPELDGIEAARRIRADGAHAELPIIALTAEALASERQRALDAGMNDFVTKPFDPEKLIANVRRHVERVRGAPLGIMSTSRSRTPKSEWPLVDGIDVDDAELRLGGDAQLFRRLLGGLLFELDGLQAALSALPDARASSDLGARMHKLRGMAGNLGARDLQRIAGEVEDALSTERPTEVHDAIHHLEAEIERVRSSARRAVAAAPSPRVSAAGAAPLDPAALALFDRYLREQNLEALALYSTLSPGIERRLGPAAHDRLGVALDSLDFATAADLVAGLVG